MSLRVLPDNDLKTPLFKKLLSVKSSISFYGGHSNIKSPYCKLDELDATLQEAFTLEEMRTLIFKTRLKNLDFLIARVTTRDLHNESLFYHFYYSADQINRILFKFEPKRKLLHRVNVKNPLNNMIIVGDILYYKISKFNIDRSIIDFLYNKRISIDVNKKAFSEILRKKITSIVNENKILSLEDAKNTEITDEENCAGKIFNQLLNNKLEIPITTATKVEFRATYFACDTDFLIKNDIRNYFKENMLEPGDAFIQEQISQPEPEFYLFPYEEDEESEINLNNAVAHCFFSAAYLIFLLALICGFAFGGVYGLILLPIGFTLLMISVLVGFFTNRMRNSVNEVVVERNLSSEELFNI